MPAPQTLAQTLSMPLSRPVAPDQDPPVQHQNIVFLILCVHYNILISLHTLYASEPTPRS